MKLDTNAKGHEMSNKKIWALITTDKDKRGVFLARIDEADVDKDDIKAEDIQMAVYWSTDMHGVLGLAAYGPSKSCRISPPVKRGVIRGVTLVVECSDEAVANWKKQPWS
jgi:hypothetical protein